MRREHTCTASPASPLFGSFRSKWLRAIEQLCNRTVQVDTLKLATRLGAGGFTVDQARAVAGALGDAAQVADLVTNADLRSAVDLLEQRMTVRDGVVRLDPRGLTVTGLSFQ
jgi:hypothetical protein